MDIDKFYSGNLPEIWEKILGPKFHYHVGSKSDNDIFDQSVKNLFSLIPKQSSVLDCGCGWGGPGKMLIEELNCNVTGITISSEQAKFISEFFVYCEDLEEYIPNKFYDIALFIESFCHLNHPQKTLSNLHDHVGKIIIKDYLWNYEWYNEKWGMYMRPGSSYINLLKKCSYEIVSCKIDDTTDIIGSCQYWFDNLKKIDKKFIVGQVKTLYELCAAVLKYKHVYQLKTATIVARPV
jgi:metal-responsive CopG/Arc/MetJ family transcriptional regulator